MTKVGGGRDIDTRGDFTVVISADDLQATDEPQRRINADGELGIFCAYTRLSHPREGNPAAGGGYTSAERVKLGKGIPLRNGAPVTVQFPLPLPNDAPPTGSAVHSSLVWFLEATLMYAKWTQGIEKVRRPIIVVNAA